MRVLLLALLATAILPFCSCSNTPEPSDGGRHKAIVPTDLLLGLTEEEVVQRLGKPIEEVGVNIDAPQEHWDRTLSNRYVYSEFQVVFNLNNKSARIDLLHDGKGPLE